MWAALSYPYRPFYSGTKPSYVKRELFDMATGWSAPTQSQRYLLEFGGTSFGRPKFVTVTQAPSRD